MEVEEKRLNMEVEEKRLKMEVEEKRLERELEEKRLETERWKKRFEKKGAEICVVVGKVSCTSGTREATVQLEKAKKKRGSIKA